MTAPLSRQITRRNVQAARDAQRWALPLLAATINAVPQYARTHNDADEVENVAAALAASFLPPHLRTAVGIQPEGQDVLRTAQATARAAVTAAAKQVHADARRTASLDAIAETDPTALDALTGDRTRLTLSKYAPDPAAKWTTTASDRLSAALSLLPPGTAATLAAMRDAWTDDSRSAVAALAEREGWSKDSAQRKAAQRALIKARQEVAPWLDALTDNPHSTRTPEQRTRPTGTRRRLVTVTPDPDACPECATLAALAHGQQHNGQPGGIAGEIDRQERHALALLDRYTAWLASRPNPPRQGTPTDHGRTAVQGEAARQRDALAAALAAPCQHAAPAPRTLATVTGTQDHAARLSTARTLAADWTGLPLAWTPEQRRRQSRADARTAALAAAQVERPGALGTAAGETPADSASLVYRVTMTPLPVRVPDRAYLLDPATGTEVEVTLDALSAANRAQTIKARPIDLQRTREQARAEQIAARPTHGAPKKASSRKRPRTGSTGPTVPAWH